MIENPECVSRFHPNPNLWTPPPARQVPGGVSSGNVRSEAASEKIGAAWAGDYLDNAGPGRFSDGPEGIGKGVADQ